MAKEFNKQLMFDNIAFLISQQGKKIGEVETAAGVSAGYISRTLKDQNTRPGIDFVVRIADALHVSIDALIGINMSAITPTEQYLLNFIYKLHTDTANDKLDWNRESPDYLNHQETDLIGNVDHPLFHQATFYEESETEYPDEVTRVVFPSHAFGYNTYIDQECFNLRLKNGTFVYLMHIEKTVHQRNDPHAKAIEVWMYSPGTVQFLCSNEEGTYLAPLVNALYAAVQESSKHPKVKSKLRYSIDAFMNDDLQDDPRTDSDRSSI